MFQVISKIAQTQTQTGGARGVRCLKIITTIKSTAIITVKVITGNKIEVIQIILTAIMLEFNLHFSTPYINVMCAKFKR